MTRFSFFAILASMLSITSCGNLEKEIDLDLPAYQSQYVVECYLEPGQPFNLLLTRSVPYFEPFPDSSDLLEFAQKLLVENATVRITHNGEVYELSNLLFFNPITNKAFNYFNPKPVPQDYDHDFFLEITTPDGKTITATTRLLPVIPIDSVVIQRNEKQDTLFRVLTYLTDPPNQKNYYRRMLHLNSLDTIPEQDFTTFDDYVDDGKIVFGTSYEFKAGDTIYNTIFHIDRAYFDFWESTFNAINANSNPFGQPSAIISNLKGDAGAIGIFTGLSYDRVVSIIE